jgi:hypothetical protein
MASSATITGYIYVPRDDFSDVLKHGYLSARKLWDKRRILAGGADKYREQIEVQLRNKEYGKDGLEWDLAFRTAALRSNYELFHSDPTPEMILAYLDWRMADQLPATLQGSKAIYFLWFPVPNEPDILREIKEHRQDFLKDKVLMRFQIPSKDAHILHINGLGINADAPQDNRDEWVQIWRDAIRKEDGEDEDRLWFDGIPHAAVVRAQGLIQVTDLQVVDEEEKLVMGVA